MHEHLSPPSRLALDEAAASIAAKGRADGSIVVVGDSALATAARERFAHTSVRLFVDTERVDAQAPSGIVRHEPGQALFADAQLVLGLLPKTLAELDELAEEVARWAAEDVLVVLAGRVKYMTPSMNAVLSEHFASVRASLGRQKSRALVAQHPKPADTLSYPRREWQEDLGFAVLAHGAAFAGTRLDIGTRALLASLPEALQKAQLPPVATVLDLGCGTGVLATVLARTLPEANVLATDRSLAAVRSAQATAREAGAHITVSQDDAGASLPSSSVDFIVLNPPFHDGTEVDERMAEHLFDAAARLLKPGGTLLTVFNAHLGHRSALSRIVGQTTQVSRTSKFVVTSSVRRS